MGNYVLLKGALQTEKGSRSNITPKFRDVYKITELLSAGFGVRILNLRTGSLQSCSHDKIHLLSLDDLISTNITSKAFGIFLNYYRKVEGQIESLERFRPDAEQWR